MRHQHTPTFYLFVSVLVACAFVLLGIVYWMVYDRFTSEPAMGVTFSWVYAQQLGLDPQKVFSAIVQDLNVRRVRLPVYWSHVQTGEQTFDWAMMDQLMEIAQHQDVQVTMVVGMKVPRWPECYIPDHIQSLDEVEQHQAALRFISQTVERYKSFDTIVRWQVENEPFFPFGECPTTTREQFAEKIALVRSLNDRPIQTTVSGELGSWKESATSGDVLGISLYRQTWNPIFGHFVYPLAPAYYQFRSVLVQNHVQTMIVSELQAEPWFSQPIESRSRTDWYDHFTVEHFEQNMAFATRVGFSEIFLWGAEWWYAQKQEGDDRLWNYARTLF